jgi:hypothetical protein
MSFYSDASLVLIPSGYKDQKIYSAKPTDGLGDLVFSRASSATRVASNGLIEKVRTNLLTYSQDLTNAAWSKFTYNGGALTVTGSQSDPFGGTNAQKLDVTIGTGGALITQNITVDATAQYGLSVWLKGAVGGEKVEFDLRDTSSNGVAGPIQTLTTTWTRYTITLTNNGGTSRGFQFRITTLQGATDCTFFAYGAQLEAGVPTDYIATTTTAVSVGPVSGLPRLDYLNSSCPRLLLEPQRTNLVTFSEQFDNAAWTKSGCTATVNAAISPSGYQDADEINMAAPDASLLRQIVTVTASTAYTFSFYVKRGTATNLRYNVRDISNSTDITAKVDYTAQTSTTAWSRISVTFTTPIGCISVGIFPNRDSSSTGTFYVWGAQLEAGAYASSYIPTLSTSVTRVADAASKTGISSLIGQTEGTLFVEVYISQLQGAVARTLIDIGSTNNRIFVGFTGGASNTMRLQIDTSVSSVRVDVRAVVSSAGTIKVAAAYKNGDCALYVNGVAGTIVANNSFSFTTISDLFLGQTLSSTAILDDGITKALLFKTRLSNDALASLTTL